MERQAIGRGDRAAIWFTAIAAVLGGAWVTAATGMRVAEVLAGQAVPVVAPFLGERAPLPIGPGGRDVVVTVDAAVVTLTDLAPTATVPLVSEAIVTALGALGALTCLALLCVNLARGIAFSRANSRLILLGTASVLVAWAGGDLLHSMGVNAALASVSDGSYDGVIFAADLTPAAFILALGAIGTAFGVGERLQRDTEGLV